MPATEEPKADRKPRPKQGWLDPKFEPPKIKAIEEAAVRFFNSKEKEADAKKDRVDDHERLLTVMREHNVYAYVCCGHRFQVKPGDAKIKASNAPGEKDGARSSDEPPKKRGRKKKAEAVAAG